jgi:hypothetical protein
MRTSSITNFFTDPTSEPLTSAQLKALAGCRALRKHRRGKAMKLSHDLRSDLTGTLRENRVSSEQFFAFQLSSDRAGPTILDPIDVNPSLAGGAGEPDVLMNIEMLSFHLAETQALDPETRATLRMNIGKDESSTDKRFEAVYWTVAAGLNLYNTLKKGRSESKDLNVDLRKALANRPIEVPGGLGRITFDVIKHKEAPWWKRVFAFLEGAPGTALVSALGFPALTAQAVKVVDELLSRLADSEPEVLFKGAPMRLALTQQARIDFTAGNQRVRLGSFNPGYCVFARGKDFLTVANSNAIYDATIGRLVPTDVPASDLHSGNYHDPLADVTYAVFRVGTRSTKLDPTFSYRA